MTIERKKKNGVLAHSKNENGANKHYRTETIVNIVNQRATTITTKRQVENVLILDVCLPFVD